MRARHGGDGVGRVLARRGLRLHRHLARGPHHAVAGLGRDRRGRAVADAAFFQRLASANFGSWMKLEKTSFLS